MKYTFEKIENCEMCGESTKKHTILGQRLNQSQGFNPKNKIGISVSISKCNNCELIYSNPQPIPFNIQDHYGIPTEEYWKPEYFQWDVSYFSEQIDIVKKLLNFSENMNALDIGCGIGKCLLSLEKSGFNAYGIESSEPFYQKAISTMKIPKDKLSLGMVEEIDYPKEMFDFITFGASFEHLYHPAKILEKTITWLKPNGIIHIEVPSSKHFISKLINLYYKLCGTNYVTNLSPMHSPFHLYEFDLKSFKSLENLLNYKVVKYKYDVCSIYHIPKIFHPILKWYMNLTNTGMQLTVYLKKN